MAVRTSALRSGITTWYPLTGGIIAWTIHLVALASLVRLTCNAPSYGWLLHAITAGCVAMTVAALVLALRLRATGARDDEAEDAAGRDLFLGRLAVIVSAFNLALIVLEEVYVVVLHADRCA